MKSLAGALDMSLTECILYKTLYESSGTSGELLRGIWDELKSISVQLSALTEKASEVAGISRAAEARALSSTIISSVRDIEPRLTDSLVRLSDAIEAGYPSERRRSAVS